MEDEWSDLKALDSRHRYTPVEWHLAVGANTYDAVRPGKAPQRTITCAYSDDYASGTVVVKRDGHFDRDRDDDRGDDRDDDGRDGDDRRGSDRDDD